MRIIFAGTPHFAASALAALLKEHQVVAVLTRPDRSEPIANRIVAEFDHQVSELYTPADRRRGYITAKDRQGILRKYALLSIAVAIVHNEYRDVTSHYEVAEIGAELKLFAKSRGGSMVVKDQRHV